MSDNSFLRLFPTPVTFANVADAAALNGELMAAIETLMAEGPGPAPRNWVSNAYTSVEADPRLHHRDAFADITEIAAAEIARFADVLGIDAERGGAFVEHCWANVVDRGQSIGAHTHANSFITAIYFVAAPDDGTTMLLYHPARDFGYSVPVDGANDLNREALRIPSKPGKMIIFESHIQHGFIQHDAEARHAHLVFSAPWFAADAPG